MAKARALDKRRKSIRNIRKITRTMELIAAARFKKAMDRAVAATDFTRRVTQLVRDLAQGGLEVRHPLLLPRSETKNVTMLILTANRGLCGGYNSAVLRTALQRYEQLKNTEGIEAIQLEVAGKRGINALKYRRIPIERQFTHFEDQPKFAEVDEIATRYLEAYVAGKLDRLEVVYTKFISGSKQIPVVETLLPLGSLEGEEETPQGAAAEAETKKGGRAPAEVRYEFYPSAREILEEIVPTSFKVRLFKCFLDAAVSEQIARRVAMKSATENANDIIKTLSRTYNRARQSQITNEIMEVIGGAEALSG